MRLSQRNSSPESAIRAYTANHFDQPLDRMQITKLAGDASTRQYYRVSLADGRSYVVARYPEPIDATTHSTSQITRLFLQAGLPVPRILDISEPEGLMLLDDLGDVRMQDWLPTTHVPAKRDGYRQAIDLILSIQEATSLAIESGSVAAHLAFDEAKLGWELAFFYENFFEKYWGLPLSPSLKSEIFDEFTAISRELASLPRVLCHRDYHSRNLMLHQGRWFIIDHQDARMGPVSYDLASLLGDPYVELDDDFCSEMYAYFVERRVKSEPKIPDPTWPTNFELEYPLMLIQRLLKATGTYAYQMAVVGNDVYLPYIPRAIQRALAALRHLNHFPTICETLEQYAPPSRWTEQGDVCETPHPMS
jgi:hypothetical protein